MFFQSAAIDVANVLLVSIIIFFFSKLYRRYYAQLRQEDAGVSSTLVEIINGAYTIKALNAEQMSFNHYEESRMQAVLTSWKTNNLGILQGFLTGIINGVTSIIFFGSEVPVLLMIRSASEHCLALMLWRGTLPGRCSGW